MTLSGKAWVVLNIGFGPLVSTLGLTNDATPRGCAALLCISLPFTMHDKINLELNHYTLKTGRRFYNGSAHDVAVSWRWLGK